jgi:peptidoglycan glycosyltransferase
VNAQIARLFGVIVILFTLLLVWTSRWTVIDAGALDNNPLNKLTLIHQETIKRGTIYADDGKTKLAVSVPAGGGTWKRYYPTGSLFAQAIGYSNLQEGEAAGLERSRGPELRGLQTGLDSIFGQLSPHPVGDDLYSTLDPTAQRLAVSQLAGRNGAVVALNPKTGAVKVLYANPSYNDNDPNHLGAGQSLFDRATQGGYPPGSTFKVVTGTAALNTGKFTPNSVINGDSPKIISGVPLENDGGKSWGPISLTTALTNSVNTVFAQVGEAVGKPTMAAYMKRFGFYSIPPLDLPPDEMAASGERLNGKLLSPTSGLIDLGRMAIGQDKLTVTPLQMAMVVSAVADRGKLMTPRLTNKVVNLDGQTVETIHPSVFSQVMKPSAASELAQMMTNVVEEGTGTPARLEGVNVAGKTGTAQVGPTGSNLTDPWFIGFAPVQNPKVAVAVVLDDIPGGFGGTDAAPIAAQIMKTLLSEGQ